MQMENMAELAGDNNRLKAVLGEKERELAKARADLAIAEAALARTKQSAQVRLVALCRPSSVHPLPCIVCVVVVCLSEGVPGCIEQAAW